MKQSFKNRHFEKDDSWGKIVLIYLTLIFMVLLSIYPLLNVFSVSLRPDNSLFSSTLNIIPENWTFDNYRAAMQDIDLLLWLRNSLIISVLTAASTIVVAAPAAYAYSRYRFKGRRSGMLMFLSTQMFPASMLLLPTYILLVKLNLINQMYGLLIPYIATALPFTVWNLKGYFETIPRSLEESAYIDGCGALSAFYRIVLPLSAPGLAISALFAFMTAWSEYIIAKVILTKPNILTLPVGLVRLQGEFTTQWGVYSAAAIITALPVVILFVSLSRFLVGGLTVGGVKE